MGAEGIVVETVDEVGAALSKACDAQKNGKTTVIEAMCTMELGDPFRRDALRKPLRVLDKYRHTNVE
jgi:sulfoacetaldehyde acetyltransferase